MEMNHIMDELLEKCMNVQSEQNVSKSRFNKCKWSFIIGRNVNAIGARNFTMPHNIFAHKGVYLGDVNYSQKPPWQIDIYNIAEKLLMIVDESYIGEHKDYCLMVSEMVGNDSSVVAENNDYMFEHVDGQDIMYQYGFTLGNYKGGNLVCKTQDGKIIQINNRRRFIRFDGRLPHKVENLVSGRRFAFLFYKTFDRNITGKAEPILQCPQYLIQKSVFENAISPSGI